MNNRQEKLESKLWNKILKSFHMPMTERQRENRFWKEMVKLRIEYIKALENEE